MSGKEPLRTLSDPIGEFAMATRLSQVVRGLSPLLRERKHDPE